MESSSGEKVKLISKEGTEIFVEKKIIIRSVYAKGQLDD